MTVIKKSIIFMVSLFLLLIIPSFLLPVHAKSISSGKIKEAQVKNKEGVREIDGKYYYFDRNGKKKKGWITWKNKKYYFGKKDGSAYIGAKKIEDELYLFRTDGSVVIGPKTYKLSGKTYLVDSSAHAYETRTGMIKTGMLRKNGIDKCSRLMIVAHPDDETYWGGGHLMKTHDYFVVCLTNADNPIRKAEYKKALRELGVHGIMLSYPDRVNGVKATWDNNEINMLRKDVWSLLTYKEWKQIVTHNPDGEYGHIHHIVTNRVVAKVSEICGDKNSLYYFGRYYSPSKLKKMRNHLGAHQISKKLLNKKLQIMEDTYVSQRHSFEALSHMAPYENFVRAKYW